MVVLITLAFLRILNVYFTGTKLRKGNWNNYPNLILFEFILIQS
jgi:hypothetical protein